MKRMNDNIDVLFFERPITDLKRYAFKIAKFLREIDANIKMASVSLELPEKELGKCVDYCLLNKQIGNIDEFLLSRKVKAIVFTNPRIPDMEMILHAHKCGVKTVMIQEGVIFEGANINDVSVSNIVATFKFIPKTFSYLHIQANLKKYAKKAYKVVVPEYNRAHIQKTWWGLEKVPTVLPNKMTLSTIDTVPKEIQEILSEIKNENRRVIQKINFP